ncbi:hypothetical protein [Comamonas aquatica]|uniref:hypothetical protein n=1 Tax=Comamonas aquatica TaxID=225991 RepID=UPI00244A3170|nr:hypothetical protein [Comamonas aquatica]MDH1673934.1 hypothetical protein [Comamonas aquatica]MDH1677204.1 hypothetical protein [Comamonas aquatica]
MQLNQHLLNTALLNTPAPPPPPIELDPPSLVAALRWGGAQVQAVLGPASLVSNMRWGQPVARLTLLAPSLKGGRLGKPTAVVEVRLVSLAQPLRFGAAAVQTLLSAQPLVAPMRWGTPQASTEQSARPLVARLSWGSAAVGAVLHAKSLRGGRLGRPSLDSSLVIELSQGLGPMRWGNHRVHVGARALPLSVRARLGRPIVQGVNPCPC